MQKYIVHFRADLISKPVVIEAEAYKVEEGQLKFFDEEGASVLVAAPGYWVFFREEEE